MRPLGGALAIHPVMTQMGTHSRQEHVAKPLTTQFISPPPDPTRAHMFGVNLIVFALTQEGESSIG